MKVPMTRIGRGALLKQFDNYANEDQDTKEILQEIVFELYYHRNDNDLELALEEIRADIIRLEHVERYERCHMLKDILDRFE